MWVQPRLLSRLPVLGTRTLAPACPSVSFLWLYREAEGLRFPGTFQICRPCATFVFSLVWPTSFVCLLVLNAKQILKSGDFP